MSYPIDAVDQSEQDREGRDCHCESENVHEPMMHRAIYRPHTEALGGRTDSLQIATHSAASSVRWPAAKR